MLDTSSNPQTFRAYSLDETGITARYDEVFLGDIRIGEEASRPDLGS